MENDLLVTITITYEVEDHPGIPQTAFFQFVDTAPEFEVSQGTLEAYEDVPGATVFIRHDDIPQPVHKKLNHFGAELVQ